MGGEWCITGRTGATRITGATRRMGARVFTTGFIPTPILPCICPTELPYLDTHTRGRVAGEGLGAGGGLASMLEPVLFRVFVLHRWDQSAHCCCTAVDTGKLTPVQCSYSRAGAP